ncbi:MAG: hypothetical protein AB7K04_16225 [Pseudorhodoplanes sp.]
MRDPRSESWHLDKRVPLAFVVALVVQTCAALVWAGSARERMARVVSDVVRVQELAERSARLESQRVDVRTSLVRIERKIDRALTADPASRRP